MEAVAWHGQRRLVHHGLSPRALCVRHRSGRGDQTIVRVSGVVRDRVRREARGHKRVQHPVVRRQRVHVQATDAPATDAPTTGKMTIGVGTLVEVATDPNVDCLEPTEADERTIVP